MKLIRWWRKHTIWEQLCMLWLSCLGLGMMGSILWILGGAILEQPLFAGSMILAAVFTVLAIWRVVDIL